MKVIITIPATVDSTEVIELINSVLSDHTDTGTEANNVTVEFVTPKLSKSDKILVEIQGIVASGEFADRNAIADSVDCTVSLISATFKENADNSAVTAYLAMEAQAKAAKKYATQLRKLQELQKELGITA